MLVEGRESSGDRHATGTHTNGPAGVPVDPAERAARTRVQPAPAEASTSASAPTPAPAQRSSIIGPLEAFLRHPVLTLLPAVLLLIGALFLGTERDPEYRAQARITVGNTNVNPFLLQEVVAGNQAIAGSYARAIAAAPVSIDAARATGITPDQAADRLAASPVAASTLIEVEAVAPSAGGAVALANAGAEALIRYVRKVNRTSEPDRLFRAYQKAQAAARRAERRTIRLIRADGDQAKRTVEARIEQDLLRLKAEELSNRYRASSAESAAASRLTLIAPAADADSDRREVLEQLLLVAGIGGLVLGFALSLLVANRHLLRALRRP